MSAIQASSDQIPAIIVLLSFSHVVGWNPTMKRDKRAALNRVPVVSPVVAMYSANNIPHYAKNRLIYEWTAPRLGIGIYLC